MMDQSIATVGAELLPCQSVVTSIRRNIALSMLANDYQEGYMAIAIQTPALGSEASAFLAKQHRLLIDGQWVAAQSGETFSVEDPATEAVIAHVPAGDKADIDLAVGAARRAFETGPWSRISPDDRSRLVWSLGVVSKEVVHPS